MEARGGYEEIGEERAAARHEHGSAGRSTRRGAGGKNVMAAKPSTWTVLKVLGIMAGSERPNLRCTLGVGTSDAGTRGAVCCHACAEASAIDVASRGCWCSPAQRHLLYASRRTFGSPRPPGAYPS